MRFEIIRKIEPQQSDGNARWWESYLVRYAIGTIIGALCVYALLDAIGGSVMAKVLMMPSVSQQQLQVLASACKDANANACVAQLQLYQDLYGFNLPQLILLGIYGLGFCYVASSPGLVVHAVRHQLVSGSDKVPSQNAWFAGIKFVTCFTMAIILIPLLAFCCADAVIAAWATLIAALILIVWQITLLCMEYQRDDLLTFYEQLHRTRKYPKISLDSYRHLREHGNAFFIVVLELMFFAVAMSMMVVFGHNPYWPVLLALWIVPGAMVYFLGHRIEALLQEKYGTTT